MLECSAKFNSILLENSSTFEEIPDFSSPSRQFHIIEKYTNFKQKKHLEKQITFKNEYIVVNNYPNNKLTTTTNKKKTAKSCLK